MKSLTETFFGIAALSVSLAASHAQTGGGTVTFANSSSTKIINGQTGNPVAAADNIRAALYRWAPQGSNNFVQVGAPVTIGIPLPGLFSGGTYTSSATPAESKGWFQICAWGGGLSTYEEALETPGTLIGQSAIIEVLTANPEEVPPTPPGSLLAGGLESFVVATNGAGPPVVLWQPVNRTNTLGTPATFIVVATGAAPLSYFWRKDGTNLVDGDRISGATTPTITIPDVQAVDAGLYSAMVSNSCGYRISSNAALTVQPWVSRPSGLVAWWAADGFALDAAGTNHGTLQNGATYAPGKVGQAFNLNGANQYVSAPDSDAWAFGTNDFTIELWANFSAVVLGTISNPGTVFVGNDEGEGNLNKWAFAHGGGELTFHVNSYGQGGSYLARTFFAPETNRWYHLAVTCATGRYRIFVDGAQVGSEANSTPIPNPTAPLTIGQAGGLGYMHGLIDEVAIFNRALTSNDIAAIYAAGTNGMSRDAFPPTILASPTNQLAALDSDVTLTVTATGMPPLSYQWRFYGTNLPNSTASSLTITAAQASQSGPYTVVVSNAYGMAISPAAVLTVVPPPVITLQPQSQTLIAGQTLILSVTATGSTPLSYQWRKDGANLVDGDRISGATSDTLLLTNVLADEVGNYVVVVSNSIGSVTSQVATLTVRICSSSWDASADYSSTSNPNGPWSYNRKWAVEGSACDLMTVRWGGSGWYLGNVGNGGPSIQGGPLLWAKANANGYPTVRWRCPVSGHYDVTGRFTGADSRGVDSFVYVVINGTTAFSSRVQGYQQYVPFSITQVALSQDDFIDFVIVWAGGVYSEYSWTDLDAVIICGDVAGPAPFISHQPQSQTNVAGGTAHFAVQAEGIGPLAYQWRFNGTNLTDDACITGSQGTNLTIGNILLSDTGNYQVVVTNIYGSATSAVATLTVVLPPFITAQPMNQTNFVGATAAFVVQAGGTAPLAYQWRCNGTSLADGGRVSGANTSALRLYNLQTGDAGNYSVVVSNAYGFVVSSNALLTVPTQQVVAWGDDSYGQSSVPPGLASVTAVGAGWRHSLALKRDGTVVAWGLNYSGGQPSVPIDLSNVVMIAGGGQHSLALRSDGTVVAWGNSIFGVNDVPLGLTNVVAVAGGAWHSLALKGDGTVVAWGAGTTNSGTWPHYGQSIVPSGLGDVVAIAGGTWDTLALKSDGTVVSWGLASSAPPGLRDVVAVAGGQQHNLALKADGSIAAWGNNTVIPAAATNVVAIAAGVDHDLALRADGTVVGWGRNDSGQTDVPSGLTNVVAIAAGEGHSLAMLSGGGAAWIVQHPLNRASRAERSAGFRVLAAGAAPVSYQWRFDGTNLLEGGRFNGTTSPTLTLSNIQAGDAGLYNVVVSNAYGMATSHVAVLTVLPPNRAPVLQDGAGAWLPAIDENEFNNWGTTVQALIASLGTNAVTDADGDVVGMAITAVNEANGVWQYISPNDYDWTDIGPVAETSARLLTPESGIRFVPTRDFFGTVSRGLSFRAWDQTIRNEGELADVTGNGGSSAFSTAVGVASTYVDFFPPPANDNFADRIVSSGASLTTWGSTVGATAEPGEPNHDYYYAPGRSVWWSWSPPTNGTYVIEAVGENLLGAYLYGIVAVYSGSALSNLVCLAEDSLDGPVNNGILCIQALAGTEYVIVVDAANWPGPLPPGSENVVLTISPGEPGPRLLVEPLDQMLFAGESFHLSTKAVGVEPLGYQWRANGTNIIGATDAYYYKWPVETQDAGRYSVLVTNAFGAVTSRVAQITILPAPQGLVLFSPAALSAGLFAFSIYSPSDATVVIQASTNLATWTDLQTNSLWSGARMQFQDPEAINNSRRFYRLKVP